MGGAMETWWIKMRMRSLKIKQKDLAARMGITQAALSQKLNNCRRMTFQEGIVLAWCLKMTANEVMEHLLDEGEIKDG